MRFTPGQLWFILFFLVSVGVLQVGYWIERKIIRRLRILAPEEWRRYTFFFGGRLRAGAVRRRRAMGGLGDEELGALLKRLRRLNAVAIGAFLGCVLLMVVFRIGW